MDKERTIAAEKARIEEEEANMLVGPELPAGVSKADMGDYGGALLPGMLYISTYRKSLLQFPCMPLLSRCQHTAMQQAAP